jgi:hypothetical protein
MKRKGKALVRSVRGLGYDAVLADLVRLVDAARHAAARSVNAVMTASYWAIGRRIVEQEQHGAERAGYGEHLIEQLSHDLRARLLLCAEKDHAVAKYALEGLPNKVMAAESGPHCPVRASSWKRSRRRGDGSRRVQRSLPDLDDQRPR